MKPGKAIAITCGVLFFWVFWYQSCLGLYTGVFSAPPDHTPSCRYLTARGFVFAPKEEAISARSTSADWCPSTLLLPRNR